MGNLMGKVLEDCAIAPRQLHKVQQVLGKMAKEQICDKSVRVRLSGPAGLLSSFSEPSAATTWIDELSQRVRLAKEPVLRITGNSPDSITETP